MESIFEDLLQVQTKTSTDTYRFQNTFGWGKEEVNELKADKEVVMAALKNFGGALRYSSDELKADPEILALIDD